LEKQGMAETPLVVGGVVTPAIEAKLREMGIAHIFPPGSRRHAILDGIAAAVAGDRRNIL
jgi:methylmalonyl-CoA mutase cobalamin-binding domain/chain